MKIFMLFLIFTASVFAQPERILPYPSHALAVNNISHFFESGNQVYFHKSFLLKPGQSGNFNQAAPDYFGTVLGTAGVTAAGMLASLVIYYGATEEISWEVSVTTGALTNVLFSTYLLKLKKTHYPDKCFLISTGAWIILNVPAFLVEEKALYLTVPASVVLAPVAAIVWGKR